MRITDKNYDWRKEPKPKDMYGNELNIGDTVEIVDFDNKRVRIYSWVEGDLMVSDNLTYEWYKGICGYCWPNRVKKCL